MDNLRPLEINAGSNCTPSEFSPKHTKNSSHLGVSSLENKEHNCLLRKIQNKQKSIFKFVKRSANSIKKPNYPLQNTGVRKNKKSGLTQAAVAALTQQNQNIELQVNNNITDNQNSQNAQNSVQKNGSINGNHSQHNLEDYELNSCGYQPNFNSFFLDENEKPFPRVIFPSKDKQGQELISNNLNIKQDAYIIHEYLAELFSENNHDKKQSYMNQEDEEQKTEVEEMSQSQSNFDEEERDHAKQKSSNASYIKESYSRREKSLEELSKKFLTIFLQKEQMMISLDKITQQLDVERRRIYDIINILESLKLVTRRGKNNYKWNGFDQIFDTISQLDGQGEGIDQFTPSQQFNEINEKKEKSLEILSIGFLKLFLNYKETLSLEEAARKLSPTNSENQKIKTKIRRLYDIANVFKSLGLIKKVQLNERKKPAFQWVGVSGLKEFYNTSREHIANAELFNNSPNLSNLCDNLLPPNPRFKNNNFPSQQSGVTASQNSQDLSEFIQLSPLIMLKGGNLSHSKNSAFKSVNKNLQSIHQDQNISRASNTSSLGNIADTLNTNQNQECLNFILNFVTSEEKSPTILAQNHKASPGINFQRISKQQEKKTKILGNTRLVNILQENTQSLSDHLRHSLVGKKESSEQIKDKNFSHEKLNINSFLSSRNSAFNLAGKQKNNICTLQKLEENTSLQADALLSICKDLADSNKLVSDEIGQLSPFEALLQTQILTCKNNEGNLEQNILTQPTSEAINPSESCQDKLDFSLKNQNISLKILGESLCSSKQQNLFSTYIIENEKGNGKISPVISKEKMLEQQSQKEEEDVEGLKGIMTKNSIEDESFYFSPNIFIQGIKKRKRGQQQQQQQESSSTCASSNQSSDSKQMIQMNQESSEGQISKISLNEILPSA